jgi:hypothetical protein
MTISSTNRRAGPYSGNGSQTAFPFSFKVFQASDMLVVKVQVSTNIETTLTLTTDYTVALNADQNSNAGGNINLVTALPTGYKLVVSSKVEYLQETDLTNQGGFYPEVITDALDRLTIEAQQLKEGLDRAAQLPITSEADAAALVADIVRIADSADNLDTVATNITNVNTVATNITNVNAVGNNITNVNAVAANETNINAVKNNSTNINAVNANKTNIDTVAGNNANVTTVAGISANVTTVAGISANVTSVAGNATNINAVAGNATNINAVNANKTNIDAVAGNSSNINSAVSNASNINSAVANMAAIIDAPTQAANAASSAAAAAASAASGMYSAVQDKSANYTVVAGDAGDLIRVTTTSGAITITLPLISTVSDGFKVAVVKWTSDSNAVNIARSGSNTINGATSAQIGSQYSQIIFVADFETNTWFASQSGLGATNVNVDVFSGNASTTAFTLSSDPSSKNNTYVSISGVYQAKSTYSVSGTTLTFSTAPPTGTSNIEVVYGTPLAIGTPSDDTVSTAKLQSQAVTTAKIADANVTTAKLSADLQGATYGFKNRIINGAMAVNQRGGGTSLAFSGATAYGLDRWNGWRGAYAANLDMSQQAGFSGYQYCLRAQRTSGTSSTQNMNVSQIIETLNCADLAGQTITLSGNIRAGANYSGGGVAIVLYGVSTTDATVGNLSNGSIFSSFASTSASITTTASTFTLSGTVPAGTKTIAVQFSWTPTGTAGAADYIELVGVQLEKGSTATSFDYRPYGTELALCQRYYWKFLPNLSRTYFGTGQALATSIAYGCINLPVTMRTTPTISTSGTATDYGSYAGGTPVTCSLVPSIDTNHVQTPLLAFQFGTAVYSLGQAALLNSATANGFLGFSAEL